MEEKQKEQATVKGKSGRIMWLIGGIAAVAVIAVITVIAGGLFVDNKEPQIPCVKINTPYIDLLLPQELESVITNDESTYGNVYTRAFYMNYGEEELPLWRIDFGDANMGDWVGILQTDQGDIPVTMTGFAISTEELAALGEEGAQLYGECMQGYSVMLDGIMSDPRFTAERPLAVGEDKKVNLTYWNVTLPGNMTVSENSKDGTYEAVFSGEVVGETVALYWVCIGENQAGSLLGYYEVDGMKKPVSVGNYDLIERDSWSEDDYAAAYRMMDTINHVIDTLMQSKQFSAQAE